VSDPATLVPLGQDTHRPRAGDSDGVVVPISDGVPLQVRLVPPPAAEAIVPSTPAPEPEPESAPEISPEIVVTEPRRPRRWFSAFCALLALAGAAATLAAPWLRPQLVASADTWLGKGNAVSSVLAPSPTLDPSWRMAREQVMRELDARLQDFTGRIEQMASAQQATAADVARAIADLRADHTASQALIRSVDDLSQQTKDLQSAAVAIDGRVRASGLLTLALRLRRDVDAGLPIAQDVAALEVSRPFPPTVDRALQKLQAVGQGTPTMRDLADEFDRVIARMAGGSDAGQSWTSRSWANLTGLFSGAVPNGNSRFIERLRALANDGRFSEAASEIDASSEAATGAEWVGRVRARANAVIATQVLLTYSLAAYQNAFAVVDAGGKLTQ
jgi:hypothetical protein